MLAPPSPVAQLAEHMVLIHAVLGSNPSGAVGETDGQKERESVGQDEGNTSQAS